MADKQQPPANPFDLSDPAYVESLAADIAERAKRLLKLSAQQDLILVDVPGMLTMFLLGTLLIELEGGNLADIATVLPALPALFHPDLRHQIAKIIHTRQELDALVEIERRRHQRPPTPTDS